MKAVALTDHGNMFGAITFYKAAKEPGSRRSSAASSRSRADAATAARHASPPAAPGGDRGGVQEPRLARVARPRRARSARPAGAPCVALDDRAGRRKGLVALTGLHGRRARAGDPRGGRGAGRARARAALRELFEPGALYVELQDHGLPEQPVLNGILVEPGASGSSLPLVATNDVHYAERDDAEAHLYLSCIKTGRSYEEAKERHHGSREMYLKSPDEMAQLFARPPRGGEEHARDRRALLGLKLKLGKPMLPSFRSPRATTPRATSVRSRARASSGASREFAAQRARGSTRRRTGSASRSSSTSSRR